MTLSSLFDIHSTGNRIDLLSHKGRESITLGTINWWESQGWEVVVWDNTGHLPAVGRNRIINSYKLSERDCLIMADDDITLYTHRYLTQDWLKSPICQGVYTLNSNHKMHYLRQNSTGWDDGQHHWLETCEVSQFYVINNKNVPLQDESLAAMEDVDWAKHCNSLGIDTHLLQTVFCREQSQNRGSLLWTDTTKRKEVYKEAKMIIKERYS